jgi:glycosyltransferase involved in cell wall biosynthesis
MGGAARMVYEQVKNTDKLNFIIKIICIDGKTNSFLEKQMLNENYDIVFLKNPRLPKKNILFSAINKIFSIYFDIISIIYLCKELANLKPDIVHAHQYGIWAGYWTIRHKIPLVTTVHSRPDGTFNRLTEKIILRFSLLLRNNTLVAISNYNRESIISYWHLDNNAVYYVNNGITIENFYSVPHSTITFINISRQDKNKNQSIIIKAFFKLYNENPSVPMKLYLVGDGDTHNSLINEAEAFGISSMIIFTGYVESPAQFLSASDIYISSSNREGLPLAVLEAMAAGLPIIATDAGGVRDLAGENGILIPCNDVQALFTAMKELRDNKELCFAKGRKSLEMVKAYSSMDMAKNYCAIYQELLEPK